MSTIADFFTMTSGAATAGLATPRVTHGTTCSVYTYGCCSQCCFCIPQASSPGKKWAYEMWGQGGGGASGCCCYYSPYGGGGANYGAARQDRRTDSYLGTCMCACSCWCCFYQGMNGHPGQFAMLCETQTIGWTMSSGGGTQGWTCCNYLWSYPTDCNMDRSILNLAHMKSSGGGGGGGSCRFAGLVPTTCSSGNPSLGEPISVLATIALQTAPAAGSTTAPGAYSTVDCYFAPSGGCCNCGTHNNTVYNCNVTERFCRNGSCGYANAALGTSAIQSNSYLGLGIGGGSYGGANAQPYHSCSGSWTWAGCMGLTPGGGGSSSGGCAGDCCYGSVGGAGLVIVSYDN